MGMFSWITSDTEESIGAVGTGHERMVYLLIPDAFGGGSFKEDAYEGYGVFGGHDVYEVVALWNLELEELERFGDLTLENKFGEIIAQDGSEEDLRGLGISIACYDKDNARLKYPIKLVENPELRYEDVPPSKSCPSQGYFYDYDEQHEDDF